MEREFGSGDAGTASSCSRLTVLSCSTLFSFTEHVEGLRRFSGTVLFTPTFLFNPNVMRSWNMSGEHNAFWFWSYKANAANE